MRSWHRFENNMAKGKPIRVIHQASELHFTWLDQGQHPLNADARHDDGLLSGTYSTSVLPNQIL